jgi:hypothetical protein
VGGKGDSQWLWLRLDGVNYFSGEQLKYKPEREH